MRRAVEEIGDWRTYFHQSPGGFLGAALATGFVLGLAAIRSRQDGGVVGLAESFVDDEETGLETYAVGPLAAEPPAAQATGRTALARARLQLSETLGDIADGLVRTAAAKAVQVVGDLVPGFNDQVEGRFAPPRARSATEPTGDEGQSFSPVR